LLLVAEQASGDGPRGRPVLTAFPTNPAQVTREAGRVHGIGAALGFNRNEARPPKVDKRAGFDGAPEFCVAEPSIAA